MSESMSEPTLQPSVYPPIEPYRSGMLAVDDLHTLYWEECGNPDGVPVLFLHGGPGAGMSPKHRQFFDPAHYRIVLFDQRGAGKSTPLGEYRDNTTQLLIADIERIRHMLGIDNGWCSAARGVRRWRWPMVKPIRSAAPALCCAAYSCAPDAEIDWFLNGIKWFFPQEHPRFVAPIPESERGDLLRAYEQRLFCDDPAVYAEAARSWSRYEGSCLHLLPHRTSPMSSVRKRSASASGGWKRTISAIDAFLSDDQLIREVGRIRHLPAIIIQGRYDVVCPPLSAHRLHQAWPQARIQMIEDAGHAAFEPGIASALVAATDQFKRQGNFD